MQTGFLEKFKIEITNYAFEIFSIYQTIPRAYAVVLENLVDWRIIASTFNWNQCQSLNFVWFCLLWVWTLGKLGTILNSTQVEHKSSQTEIMEQIQDPKVVSVSNIQFEKQFELPISSLQQLSKQLPDALEFLIRKLFSTFFCAKKRFSPEIPCKKKAPESTSSKTFPPPSRRRLRFKAKPIMR